MYQWQIHYPMVPTDTVKSMLLRAQLVLDSALASLVVLVSNRKHHFDPLSLSLI
jgi:hypothetical protein